MTARQKEGESMSNPYERVKGGRLSFKGGIVASRSKAIDKKKKKKEKDKKIIINNDGETETDPASMAEAAGNTETNPSSSIYTIDAAKRMKYEELFPVEAKKFGYTYNNNKNNNNPNSNFKPVEEALDDRVKKKADRYCK